MNDFNAKYGKIIFDLGVILYFSTAIIEMTSNYCLSGEKYLSLIIQGIQMLAYMLFLVRFVINIDIKDRKRAVLYVIILVVFCISGINIGHKFFVLTAIAILSAMGIGTKNVAKITMMVQGTMLFGIIVLSQVGVIQDYVFEDRNRHSMGFSWATTAPILFFYFSLAYMYVRENKFKWFEAIALEMISIYLYIMTDTRMTFALSTLSILFFGVQTFWKKPWRFLSRFKWLYAAVPVLFATISVVATKIYNPLSEKWVKINKILTGRLQLGQYALNDYKITLFGQDIEWRGYGILNGGRAEQYNYVDCSYIQILLSYGILVLLVVLFIYTLGIVMATRINDYCLVFIILFALVHGLTEPHLIAIAPNIIFLLPLAYVNTEKSKESKVLDTINENT